MTGPFPVLLLDPVGPEDWGGGETGMLRIAAGLGARGWPVTAAGRRGSVFLSRMAAAGVTTLPLCLRRDFGLVDALRLRTRLRRGRVPVVIAKLNRGIRTAGLARALGGRAAIVQQQGLFEIRDGFRQRFAYRWVERILTPARSIRRLVSASEAFPGDRVDWVPNGVDAERFRPDPGRRAAARRRFGLPDGVVVACTARLHRQKAHDVLLDAFCRLPPRARLALAGHGCLEPQLRSLAAELGIADRVHFLGHVDDVPDLLRAADVLVSSSWFEGMPNNVLEAMATGLPIVATDVGDVALMLDGGAAGVLVPPGDPAALAAAMRSLLDAPERRAALGEAARRRAVERYPVSAVLDGVAACLSRAASTRRAGGAPPRSSAPVPPGDQDRRVRTRKSRRPRRPSAPPTTKLAE